MSIEVLRDTLTRLQEAAGALAALGAALDARVNGALLAPEIEGEVAGVLAALGVGDGLSQATPVELRSWLGEIRAFGFTNQKLLFAASQSPGWRHTEPEMLEAAGDVSLTFPRVFQTRILPGLPGLAERLSRPGAAFLDVGTGVAAMAAEMARAFPGLRVVGLEPWGPAIQIARQRIRKDGLEARVELRELPGEALSDQQAFDLAWIPGVFIGERALAGVVARVHEALRPGGFLLFPVMRATGDPLAVSLSRLRTTLFGGYLTTPEAVVALLAEHGFAGVKELPARPTALTTMVVAQRAP